MASSTKKVAIKHQPKTKCGIKKPTYDGKKTFKVSWSFKGTTKNTSRERAEYFKVEWQVKFKGVKKQFKKVKVYDKKKKKKVTKRKLVMSSDRWWTRKTQTKIKIGKSGSAEFSLEGGRDKYAPVFSKKISQGGTMASKRVVAVRVRVCAYNSSKVSYEKITVKNKKVAKNPLAWSNYETFQFKDPDKPKMGGWSFNPSNRQFTVNLYPAENKSPKDRYYTFYNVWHKYSWDTDKGANWHSYTSAGDYNKAAEYIPYKGGDGKAVTYELPSRFDSAQLSNDDWVLVKARAYSIGMTRSSIYMNAIYRAFGYPAQVAITGITLDLDKNWVWDSVQKKFVDQSGAEVRNGNIIVRVAVVKDSQTTVDGQQVHPIDSMHLEVLRNSTISDPVRASIADGWTEVDSGNSKTTALTDLMADSRPAAKRKVWYRVRTVHDHLERFSMPYRASDLEWDQAAAGLIDAIVKDDGENPTGIQVIYGFNEEIGNRVDGVEISWSKYKNAVNSNQPPDTGRSELVSDYTKTDDRNKKYNTTYQYTSYFFIVGLEEGEKYYVATRGYSSAGGEESFSSYSYYTVDKKPASILFARKPEDVRLSVPESIASIDDGIEVSWDFASSVKQKSYILYYCLPQKDAEGKIVFVDGSDTVAETLEKSIVSGDSEQTYYNLTKEQLKDAVFDGLICLRVAVSCAGPSGPYAKSNNSIIKVSPTPTLSIRFKQGESGDRFVVRDGFVFLTRQSGVIEYQVSRPSSMVYVTIEASGFVGEGPDGDILQAEGDVLYSGVIADPVPNEWQSFSLPVCDFQDVASYKIKMVPVSTVTGLKGNETELGFSIAWDHQATMPDETSYVIGDSVDQTATIYPVADEDSYQYEKTPDTEIDEDTVYYTYDSQEDEYVEVVDPQQASLDTYYERVLHDVCDVYRVTPDGVYSIGSDILFGTSVVDQYAPFSNAAPLKYRLVTKTEDGDIAWRDVSYMVHGHSIRFDWVASRAGKTNTTHTVSLPYNLRYTDKWTKQFEGVRDLAGGKTGWWLPGVDRTVDLSTDLVRLSDFETKTLVRELANHSGPVFVRTPNGCAYTANVEVTAFPDEYDSLVQTVTFTAEEIDMIDEFRIPVENQS